MKRTLLSLLIGTALVISPVDAYAATADEISEVLFEETTEFLEIEIDDPDLAELVLSDLEYALEEEIVDPEMVEEIDAAIDGERETDLDNLYEENSGEQEQSWLEKSPELLNAFDLVKFEFHQCRILATGGANECAQGLGFKLQVASVQLALADLEQQKAALEGLEGAELEEALDLISGQENALVEKLIRAEQKLSRVGAGGEGAAELQTAVSEAKEAGITTEGNQGNGNQGNRGND